MENIKLYIKDWFIDVDINKVPPSLYIIRKTLLKAVGQLKPKLKGRVLDVGCGIMPYRDYLNTPEIDEYIGIDLQEPTAYQNFIKPDLYWDGKRIPLEDSSCDFVIATEFFEHYFDTQHILGEVNRVLKKGGILFFTIPSIWPLHAIPYDYHRFTPYALFEYFQKSGFSKWDVRALGGIHVSVALILSFWFEKIPENRRVWFLGGFLKIVIKFLMKRNREVFDFKNGDVYSGLYGFVQK